MDERWFWAGLAVSGGLFLGVSIGFVLRYLLDREDRRPALRETASPLSLFVFWFFTTTGIVLAVSVSSPETLRPIPADILDWLPNLALAGLLVIGGYALGLTLAATVRSTVTRASGVRYRVLERAALSGVFGGALILALSQLGVDTTVLNILIGGLAFGFAAALAGIAVVGSRSVAGHVAAGRTLQTSLRTGMRVRMGEISGEVVETQIAHVLLDTDQGQVLVPYGAVLDEPIYLLGESEQRTEGRSAT